jgi:hypothetical protein
MVKYLKWERKVITTVERLERSRTKSQFEFYGFAGDFTKH